VRITHTLPLIFLLACQPPVNTPSSTATSRKVIFQPPPPPVPSPLDGKAGVYPTRVDLLIDERGQVIRAVPKEGIEPFLSTTIRFAKSWQFSSGFPTTPDSPLPLSVSYTWGSSKTINIQIKP